IFFLFFSNSALAHHTKEHTMLMESPEQVIASTLHGEANPWAWVLWLAIVVGFSLGLFKLIYKK
ncbi:MAG: hypothetical protein OEM07_02965, partial [Gammaproteobacteria bacterium]|nr:hypothetical protein [Gammaproteobacteria bacterium]